jgi:hypothetical protein
MRESEITTSRADSPSGLAALMVESFCAQR